MDNNWKTATKADRAALYDVARAVADTTNLNVEAIMEQAFGHKLMVGTDYLSNFRSGTIGRPKAKLIHAWIAEHHAETAYVIDPKLFPKPHTDVWADYLENHAIHGKLSIARFDKSMGLVQRTPMTTRAAAPAQIKGWVLTMLGSLCCTCAWLWSCVTALLILAPPLLGGSQTVACATRQNKEEETDNDNIICTTV